MSKKGILVVSFGTSVLETFRDCIESTENRIKESFEGYEVRRAFTSYMIIKKLKEENKIFIDTTEEALEKMKSDGFTEVYVQPLHIMPGDEYDKIINGVNQYKELFDKLVLGRPILYREKDYLIAAEALKTQLPQLEGNSAVVLMGHGSTHPANASYTLLQSILHDNVSDKIYVGTVEGYPMLEHIIPKLKKDNIEEVTLMPFMLVAGDHAINDMASDEEDSWKSILEKEGFKVNVYLHGLGENGAYQQIYVQHIKDCIDGNPLMIG
ncbi:sirohydrochlorin cobaltochelatase [Clostridium sp. CX1]|uniref:Sirohydrochlorin cobaltochelatase n=1 Tax=Clostridium tanneri TaxID=3037988 RepID=A0ABU4JUJ9_9CLOT|nr:MULTISPECIES: sirohydrochlorin cobaltochelatase [unclassified Clostridium]MCT8976621.1 sirohydrochlorin cobaltochelatase [Clostridium sp. CX1]MDW8801834.1 sirohydrochlorin cobaltochelatase [Clostridium sp. A1-XYC3]